MFVLPNLLFETKLAYCFYYTYNIIFVKQIYYNSQNIEYLT